MCTMLKSSRLGPPQNRASSNILFKYAIGISIIRCNTTRGLDESEICIRANVPRAAQATIGGDSSDHVGPLSTSARTPIRYVHLPQT